jgi:hypothetical protein
MFCFKDKVVRGVPSPSHLRIDDLIFLYPSQRFETSKFVGGQRITTFENCRPWSRSCFHCSTEELHSWGTAAVSCWHSPIVTPFKTLCIKVGYLYWFVSDFSRRLLRCGTELLKCCLGLPTTLSQSTSGLWVAFSVRPLSHRSRLWSWQF